MTSHDPAAPRRSARGMRAVAFALAALALFSLPATAGEDEDDHVGAMAREHQHDTPAASPAAQEAARRVAEGSDAVYATIAGSDRTGYFAKPTKAVKPADTSREGVSQATQALPGIIVIHEWWGLNDNIRAMTRELASQGYWALAVDMYGGKPAQTPTEARALMQQALGDPSGLQQNLRQANAYLRSQGAPRTGSIGWCFGGGLSLEAGLLLGSQIDAVVMYYGRPVTQVERLRSLRAPLLGLFGAEDSGIPLAGVRSLEENLEQLGKPVEIHVYPGAGHAFANPSGSRYQAEAAEDAWKRTLAFFRQHLAPPP